MIAIQQKSLKPSKNLHLQSPGCEVIVDPVITLGHLQKYQEQYSVQNMGWLTNIIVST